MEDYLSPSENWAWQYRDPEQETCIKTVNIGT